ncbi:tRNA isopentenyltransferas-like protein [Venturia nashicola]|uniref:tRNA dimethylallyltransferase n=1 Tax=Venturia nashicola TaxID=86259 RepID=A0A4Z1NXE7_9PEZI|nr:tRNA isopentenyltransferas-like protein [Venturia nashicola]TLD27803.1 tRNA isopentenyltransferas-like protein [Venturia nashicola]
MNKIGRAWRRNMVSLAVEPPKRLPLIVVVGATGTGKSQLAVEIATRFNGEIINGDAMQLYEGLPIITNKMPENERNGIRHHLLGCIRLDQPTWTVGQFVRKARETIHDVRARGRLPILVGGTHYYEQALLFKDQIVEQTETPHEETFPILQEPTDVILARLRELDPVIADRWHPNDRRKIQRSLEICLKTGKPASQIYAEQKRSKGSDTEVAPDELAEDSPSLIEPILVLWVHAAAEKLKDRLDARVLEMVKSGLLEEVTTVEKFLLEHEANREKVDRTRGIWVSIGYKEFEEYQMALRSRSASNADVEKLKQVGIERTQAATRQYSKRQVRWIRIKLLNALHKAGASNTTFLLDGSNIQEWHKTVAEAGVELVRKFLAEECLPDPGSLSEVAQELLAPKSEDLSQRRDLWERKVCEACGGVVCVTPATWETHLKSKGHRWNTAPRKPREYPAKRGQSDVISTPGRMESAMSRACQSRQPHGLQQALDQSRPGLGD